MNDNNSFTETTTTSWIQRIKNALFGVIIGIALFIGAFPLLWWNEGQSVARIKTLDEGRGLVIPVSSSNIDNQNAGKLIHTTGKATTKEILTDTYFGVSENALRLQRIVEMYQWKESQSSKTTKNMGGSETTETTYSYNKVWEEGVIDSTRFKKSQQYKNPTKSNYTSQIFSASKVNIDKFNLNSGFISKINNFQPYPLSNKNHQAMHANLQASFQLNGTEYFYGDPSNPQIGSLRIKYKIIPPSEISVIGKQDGSNIATYFTTHGDIALLSTGTLSADQMFADAEDANTIKTWLIRLAGIAMLWIGFYLIFNPLKVLADVVPFIGTVLAAGLGFIAGIVALSLGFVTIATAWIFYRPLIGIALLLLVGGIIFGGFSKIKKALKRNKVTLSNNQHIS